MNVKAKITTGIAAALVMAVVSANAIQITLGGPLPDYRTATLGSADAGATGSGNATVTEVNAAFSTLAPWTDRAESTAGGSSDANVFVVSLTSGSWGNKKVAGTWEITDSDFWTTYANAAISLHVGNGGPEEPDHFIWLLEKNKLTGTWSYDGTGLNGGGLSNLKLYSSGVATRTPDSGVTLALLGLGMLGLGALRRKIG